MPTYTDPGPQAFTAVLTTDAEHAKMGGMWVEYPHDVLAQFGVKGRVPVRASFDGVPYTGSLCRMGAGRHTLLVRKEIRQLLKKGAGDKVRVTVQLDAGERTVEVPPELADGLAAVPGARAKFDAMSFTCRKEYAGWVAGAKKADTRERRVAKAVEMIVAGKKFS